MPFNKFNEQEASENIAFISEVKFDTLELGFWSAAFDRFSAVDSSYILIFVLAFL